MKKINYLLSSLAIVAMLTSCEKDNTELASGAVAEDVVIEVSQDGTRTSINDLATVWATGDELSVFNNTSKNSKFAFTSGAAFSGPLTLDGSVVYALYPYTVGDKTDITAVPITVSATQVQNHDATTGDIDATSLGDYALMAGKTSAAVASGTIAISMTNLMSIFDINLTGIATNTKIISVTVVPTVQILTSGTVNFNDAIPVATAVETPSANIAVALQTGGVVDSGVEVLDGSLVVRMAMLPQAITPGEWTITVVSSYGGEKATQDFTITSTATSYIAGKRYPVPVDLGTERKGFTTGLFSTSGSYDPPTYPGDGTVTLIKSTEVGAKKACRVSRKGTYAHAPGRYSFRLKDMSPDFSARLYFQNGGGALIPANNKKTTIQFEWNMTKNMTEAVIRDPRSAGKNSSFVSEADFHTITIHIDGSTTNVGQSRVRWYLDGDLIYAYEDTAEIGSYIDSVDAANNVAGVGLPYVAATKYSFGVECYVGNYTCDWWEFTPNAVPAI